MAFNLKPACPTCSTPMRQLKQVAKEEGYKIAISKGFCPNCNAWKDVNPEQRMRG